MSTKVPAALSSKANQSARVAIAAARFNADLVDELLSGCLKRLAELGIAESSIDLVRVPGAFELPVTARVFAETGRYQAVICLGAVVRGDTPHFEYVAGECARGLQTVAISLGLPVIFGVLTTNTHEQAVDRIGGKHGHAGERAADAAVEMMGVVDAIARRPGRASKSKTNPRKRTR